MDELLRKLGERKLVQWALAYIAAAFALIQVTDVVGQQFDWPDSVRRGITITLVVGFLVALVLAWYHGERGAQRFSGAELLIIALLLTIGGSIVWRLAPRSAEAPSTRLKGVGSVVVADRKSIAVLPFANLSSDRENDYFADGMRDMILTKLATIGELKVISRTSTDKYAGHPDDLKAVALQLGVANVLEGSVQKSGNQVLINLQLISAGNDQHLWAEAYKRTIDDLFGVEGEIAETVAQALNAKLSEAEQKSIAAGATKDAEAFDLFLRAEQARYEATRTGASSSANDAVALYERAVARDPNFALAWAGMSWMRSSLYWARNFDRASMQETARLALQNAERALALQPASSEANLAMGFYHYYVRLDLAQALVSFETAMRAKPNDATVLYSLGLIARRLGRFDDAIDRLQAASRLDPRNQVTSQALMTTLVMTRRYSAAKQICERELSLEPANPEAAVYCANQTFFLGDDIEGALTYLRSKDPTIVRLRAAFLSMRKRYAEAIALIEAMPDTKDYFSEDDDTKSEALGYLYLESGRADVARPLLLEALARVQAASARVPDEYTNAAEIRLEVGYVEALLGQAADAIDTVSNAVRLPGALPDKNYVGWVNATARAAQVYARLRRPDLAVPLLETLLASPGTGFVVSYAALRLDPDFAPIRGDPAFQALIKAHPGSGDVRE